MKKRGYVPDRGDLVWLQFNPQSWHEQAGHRSALALSPAGYKGLVTPSADHRTDFPKKAAQPAMGLIGIQPGMPEQ
jgi:mRNA interferase MazF